MTTENTTITIAKDQTGATEDVFQKMTSYLERSAHCQDYLLTRHLDSASYILSSSWDNDLWRGFAWRYFRDLFTSAGVEFQIAMQAGAGENMAQPEVLRTLVHE
jgi:hypothetical protein